MSLLRLSASALARRIRAREVSVEDVLEQHLAAIERLNPLLNALVTLDAAAARAQARAADLAAKQGRSWGPLHGVPFTLKDHHEVAGMRATLGEPGTARVPEASGVVVERLQRAGAILLGKTNMAFGVQSNSRLFGRTNNPYDPGRSAGGSSSGAAAAVAAGLSAFDVGSDASGSIRMPAHFCGVFGLKPTQHRIPIVGLGVDPPGTPRVDRTLGVCGPIARSAEDLGLILSVLVGSDPRDPDCPPVPLGAIPRLEPRELRLACMASLEGVPNQRAQHAAIERAAARFSAHGVHVEDARLPFSFSELLAAARSYFPLLLEGLASSGASTQSQPKSMASASLALLQRALAERDRLAAKLECFFERYDAILCPTAIRTAFPHAPPGSPIEVDGTPHEPILVDHPCLLASFLGVPALCLPIACDPEGLPIGAQVVARRWQDARLIGIGMLLSELCEPIPPAALAA